MHAADPPERRPAAPDPGLLAAASRTERTRETLARWARELAAGAPETARRRPSWCDLPLVMVLAAIAVGGLFMDDLGDAPQQSTDAFGVVLALLTALPLLWRRTHALRVVAACTAPLLLMATFGYASAGASLGQLVAMYSAAIHRSRVPAVAALLLAESSTLLWIVLRDTDVSLVTLITNEVGLFAVWAFGRSVGFRRAYTAELEVRAERLEHTREADMRAALAEERGRIARELHDVVAHHVSVMTVQASAAQRMVDRKPDRAREAMAAVEHTGRAAMVEMRRLVGILRDSDPGQEPPPGRISEGHHAPQPGLDEVETLVTQVRDAGLPVELAIEGVPCQLTPGIDLAAYRIVQEALTNTLKHAGPASSRVLLRFGPEELLVRVADDGQGGGVDPEDDAAERRPGHGLLGMRERVSLYGGRLYAGPRAGSGFEVLARIPLTGENGAPSAEAGGNGPSSRARPGATVQGRPGPLAHGVPGPAVPSPSTAPSPAGDDDRTDGRAHDRLEQTRP